MDSFGETIRKLREEKGFPLRTVAAFLDIDQAVLSKIERGLRKASRENVIKLSQYFKVSDEDLLVAWLSDKFTYNVTDEKVALKALKVAEEKVTFQIRNRIKSGSFPDRNRIKKELIKYFKSQSNITKVWVFGSFTREDFNGTSDIDLLIEVPSEKKFTLFDISDVRDKLEQTIRTKVDVVMLNALSLAIKERIKNDLQLIYEAR